VFLRLFLFERSIHQHIKQRDTTQLARMESHRIKSLSDGRSKNRLRFATTKQKSKRASADVYRKYKRRIGVTSSATREENVHHHSRPSKRSRNDEMAMKDNAVKDVVDAKIGDSDIVGEETTLAAELDLANDRNASEIFGQFYREVWPLVRSLPELIHHSETIIELMLRYLLSPEDAPGQKSMCEKLFDPSGTEPRRYQINHATAEIFHLLAVCSRDLRHEIHPWLHKRVFPRIFGDLLNPPLPASGKQPIPLDVSIIEAAFRSVAYILRYDAECLLLETGNVASKESEQPCLEPMRKHYGATLTNKRPLIRRLAAETFAPLIRKLKSESSKKRHLRRVLRALDASANNQDTSAARQRLSEDAVDGVSQLCFEVTRGMSGEMNSKGAFVIDSVLSSVVSQSNKGPPLSCEVALSLFSRMMGVLSVKNSARLIMDVESRFPASLDDKGSNSWARQKESVCCLLRLATDIVSYSDGAIVAGEKPKESVLSIIEHTTQAMLTGELDLSCQEEMAKLFRASFIAYQNDSDFVSFLRGALASILGVAVDSNDDAVTGANSSVSSSFCNFATKNIFSCLSLDMALKYVGSILLVAALNVDKDDCIGLIHGIACFEGDRVSKNDDTFFPENAYICGVKTSVVDQLLDRVLLPYEGPQEKSRNLMVASKCATFLASCCENQNHAERLYKRVSKWLVGLLTSIPSREFDTISLERKLLFCCSLEALARLSSIALDRGASVEVIEAQLGKVTLNVEDFITKNSSSVSGLKSGAIYCTVLTRLSTTLTENSNPIFEVLTPNLCEASHFTRKYTLQIMNSFPKRPYVTDYADLDLGDDLDEEPNSATRNEEAKGRSGPVGACDILETLLTIESLPLELASERPMLSLFSRIEILGRTGKLPVVYAEAVAAHLVGLLHLKFSPAWDGVIKTLAIIARQYKKDTWKLIFSKLVLLMGDTRELSAHSVTQARTVPTGFDLDTHFQAFKDWESSNGCALVLFDARVKDCNEEGRVSMFEFRKSSDVLKSLWELFQKEPSLIIGNSRDVIPLVIRFFRYQYFADQDPDSREIFADPDFDTEIGPFEGEKSSHGVTQQKLLSILKAFAALKGPEQLYWHRKLYHIFMSIIGHNDAEIASTALECVLRFKPDFVLPYAADITQLFAKGKLRDSMIRLKEYSGNGKISKSHREKLIPLLARILIGRLSAKSVGKSNKDSPAARRTAVFSFASGFCERDDELFPFLFLSARRYLPSTAERKTVEQYSIADHECFRSDLTKISVDECNMLPTAIHEGFLNVLEAIISQLGHRVVVFLPSFMAVVLSLLEQNPLKQNDPGKNQNIRNSLSADPDGHSNLPDRAGRVRSLCFLRLGEMFNKYSHVDFSPYSTRLWNSVEQSIALLPQLTKSAEKAPALLQMLVILSKHDKLRDLLCQRESAVENGFSCLSQTNSTSAVDTVLSLIENLVDTATDDEGSSASDAVCSHIPTLLSHFQLRLEAFGTTLSWKRELSILGRVCEVSKRKSSPKLRSQELDSLTLLLIPFLEFKSKSSERDRLHILEILESTIPSVHDGTACALFSTVSVLLGPFKAGPGYSGLALRQKLATSLRIISEHHLNVTKPVCKLVEDLNAMNARTIEEMNADAILSALKEMRKPESDKSWVGLLKTTKTRQYLGPLIRSCFHLLHVDDGVVARAAFYTLKDLVDQAKKMDELGLEAKKGPDASWEKFLEQAVVPMIRSGIACKNASARRFFVLLAADVSKVCQNSESPHLLGDLSTLLCESEPDLDFFLNITHVQIHRRSRGLNRLRKQIVNSETGKCQFSPHTISGVLVPIALHPIYESKTKLEEPLAMEAIATLGVLVRHIPWRKFQDELCTLLAQVDRQTQQERYIIGAICSMLSGFHFDVGNPYSADPVERSGTAVWTALEKRIIPKLEGLFTKEKDGKKGDKIRMVRPQVILALTELYTNLPRDILRNKLPRLLTVLCDALKSRESDARDLARNTLAKLSVKVGLIFLPDIIRELAITLREGYKLHVRAAAVHSILLEIAESDYSNDTANGDPLFDLSVPALMDLVQRDLFGTAQARKDAEFSQVRYIKEAGGSKSLHSIELISKMLRVSRTPADGHAQSSVYAVVSPLLSRIQLESQNSKQLRQLKECLVRVVQGLSKNTTFTARDALPLIFATIEPCISKDVSASTDRNLVEASASNIQGEVAEWRPSAAGLSHSALDARNDKLRVEGINRKVIDGDEAPKLTGSGRRNTVAPSKGSLDEPSSVAAVVFGLQLLRHVLKSCEATEDVKQQISPFVPLLTECICHCRDSEAVLLALRCLGEIKGMASEPSFDSSSQVLAAKTLDLLVGYGGNEDLLQASFKMMAFLIERGKKSDFTEKDETDERTEVLAEEQMELLLSFLQTSLTNTAQHNPAMNLIKALVGRRIISPGMYDLMKVVLEQSVQSHKESLRQQATLIYVRFLMNYPMTSERMERELKKLLMNIQYEGVEGRHSAINMIASVIRKFPEPVVVKHSSLFFVALTMQLGNEESEKGRQAVSDGLSTLLSRLPADVLQSLLDYAFRWAQESDVRLQRVSLSVLGLFIESSDILQREPNFKELISVTGTALSLLNEWEVPYFSLRLLEKAHGKWPGKVSAALEVWPKVVRCLSDCHHAWVTSVSLRLLFQHLQSLDPESFVKSKQITFLQKKGNLFQLLQSLCATLDCEEEAQVIEIEATVKALTWVMRVAHKHPELCFVEEYTGSESRDPIRWMMARLSQIAKPKGTKRRQAIFKCFAAFAKYGENVAFDHLELMLDPLYRVEREARHEMESAASSSRAQDETPSEEIQLAQDVLHLLEQLCTPHEKFIEAYGAVKQRAQGKKQKRAEESLSLAARDPRAAAEQKAKKQGHEKKRRKRRIDERRQSRGRVARPRFS